MKFKFSYNNRQVLWTLFVLCFGMSLKFCGSPNNREGSKPDPAASTPDIIREWDGSADFADNSFKLRDL